MYCNIFDSHAHYDDEAFAEDRFTLLDSLFKNGVIGFVNCGSDLNSSKKSLEIARRYSGVYAAAGIHPHEAEKAGETDLKEIEALLNDDKCVAVGEIGLDYHYDFSPRDRQKEIFEYQLSLANKYSLPVIIHDREAHEDTLNLLKKYRPKGVVHCFSGSAEMAKEIYKLGMYIGISGVVTFKNARKLPDVVKEMPMDRFLLETDAPYLAPVPFRGKINNSSLIYYSAEKIGEIRGISTEDVLKYAMDNTKRLYNL